MITRISYQYSGAAAPDSGLQRIAVNQTRNSDPKIIIDDDNQNTTISKIEKHISDVKNGNGDISRDVAYKLAEKSSNASSLLSRKNPALLSKYSGYLSAFRYDRAARFVNAVEYSLARTPGFSNNEE